MAFKYGRTEPKKQTIFGALKSLDFRYLKSIKWKDLPPEQRKKVVGAGLIAFLCLICLGLFSQNDEDMFKGTINDFIKESADYNLNGVGRTTTSAAHQLVVGQSAKISQAKARNFKTVIDNTEINIVSKNGNSMIATAKVDTTEQMGHEKAQTFTHAFIFQGQKVGATWKIANLLESEARAVDRSSAKTEKK